MAGVGLRCQPQGALNIGGQSEALKETSRVEVILARFVDDADEMVRLRVGILHYSVQLPDLQRDAESRIPQTDRVLLSLHSARHIPMKF